MVSELRDVLNNTVQSATSALPQLVQMRMCDGEGCSADTEYHIVLSLFPAGDGRILWENVDGAEVLQPIGTAPPVSCVNSAAGISCHLSHLSGDGLSRHQQLTCAVRSVQARTGGGRSG